MKRWHKLRFNKWNLLILIALGTVIFVIGLFVVIPRKYEAQSYLTINQELFFELTGNSDSPTMSPTDLTIEELQELLNTDSFIRLLIFNTNLESQMQLGEKVVRQTIVDVRSSIEIMKSADDEIEIQATWIDEITAGQLVNSLAESFIEWKDRSDRRDSLPMGEFLELLDPQYEQDYLRAVASFDAFVIENPEPTFGERSESELTEIDRLMLVVEVAKKRYQTSSTNLERIRLEEEEEELNLSSAYSARLYVFED